MTEQLSLLSPDDWVGINEQRAITTLVNRDIVKVGAVYLRPTSKVPVNDNWSASKYLDTDLRDWIDNELYRFSNVGFNLQQGWVDIDVDGDDTEYNKCIHSAMQHVGVDCRLAFGRKSAGVPRHFLVQLSEEESRSFDEFKQFEPKAIRIRNQRFYTDIRSGTESSDDAKQTVVPGSLYGDRDGVDVSVWWTDRGRIAKSLGELTQTSPRATPFNWLIRAIAFGTILYLIKPQWVPGIRQDTALKFNGWLARIVDESFAINNSEQLSQEVHCPIDHDDIAQSLLDFICRETSDDEAYMRKRTYKDARDKLSRNPDARIPGWPSMKALFGEEIVAALRAICAPGTDTNVLMQLVEQYVYDDSNGLYIDRYRHKRGDWPYAHSAEDLYRRHKSDVIMLGGKPKEAFKSFEMSKMRVRVGSADLYPQQEPLSIFRVTRSGKFVGEDYEGEARLIYNHWTDWDHKPPTTVNIPKLKQCEEKLDKVLAWLTCNNREQAQWIKEWFGWTIQHPGEKQQIAWVVVGGQGVGKSFIGTAFAKSLFGRSYGMVNGKQIGERFSVSPFMGKMFVFADEVKFKSHNAIDELKLLIRNVQTHGEQKGLDSRDYNIYARLMFASNNMDVRISESNTVDRALFFTKAYTPEFMGTSQQEFNRWTLTHKTFFDEFADFLTEDSTREHYQQIFQHIPVNRHNLESLRLSSSSDPDIVASNMSNPRKVAKFIVENGAILEDLDISTPFVDVDFMRSVSELIKTLNINTNPRSVLTEFDTLGMLELVTIKGKGIQRRFKWHIGTLTEKFGEAIGVDIAPRFEFGPGDFGPNTHDGTKVAKWKGSSRFGSKF